jgi:hypothetical protein
MLIRMLAYIVFIVLSAQQCFAAPAISGVGTVTHGASVTIAGGGFGANAEPAPELWDNFEFGGNVGQSVAFSSGGWATDGTAPVISTTNNRGGASVRNAMAVVSGINIDGNYHDIMFKENLDLAGKAYISFWGRFASYAPGDQVKYWRQSAGGATGYPTYSYFRTDGWARYQYTRPPDSGCEPPGVAEFYDTVENTNLGQWQFIEMVADYGSVGVANGSIRIYANGVDQGGRSNIQLLHYAGCLPDGARFGEYIQDSSGSVTNYFDDIYIDNTWARVVIGNASTYSASTHREMQIPSAWSDTSITVTVNRGTFAPGGTAYLYVIDPAGVVSAGYPITVNDPGGDTTAPTVTISTADPQNIAADSLSVAWSDSDAVGVTARKWRIGAAPNALDGTAATSPATVTGFNEGTNTLYVGAGDAAGNWGSDAITVNYAPESPTPNNTVQDVRYNAAGKTGRYSNGGMVLTPP